MHGDQVVLEIAWFLTWTPHLNNRCGFQLHSFVKFCSECGSSISPNTDAYQPESSTTSVAVSVAASASAPVGCPGNSGAPPPPPPAPPAPPPPFLLASLSLSDATDKKESLLNSLQSPDPLQRLKVCDMNIHRSLINCMPSKDIINISMDIFYGHFKYVS